MVKRRSIKVTIEGVDRSIKNQIGNRLPQWMGKILNRVAWPREKRLKTNGHQDYSDLDWDGKSKRINGWMPVDTGRAIASVKPISTNAKRRLIIIGGDAKNPVNVSSNVNYMPIIEDGSRMGIRTHPTTGKKYFHRGTPAFMPFRRGVEYAFIFDIQPEIEDIIKNTLDEGIEDMLNAIEINFK